MKRPLLLLPLLALALPALAQDPATKAAVAAPATNPTTFTVKEVIACVRQYESTFSDPHILPDVMFRSIVKAQNESGEFWNVQYEARRNGEWPSVALRVHPNGTIEEGIREKPEPKGFLFVPYLIAYCESVGIDLSSITGFLPACDERSDGSSDEPPEPPEPLDVIYTDEDHVDQFPDNVHGLVCWTNTPIRVTDSLLFVAETNRFAELVATADKIVVRKGGYICHSKNVDEQPVAAVITNASEIAAFNDSLRFYRHYPGMSDCMCCGYPGIDWWVGDKKIVLSNVQHCRALRWEGFGGDMPLVKDSSKKLQSWLQDHGIEFPGSKLATPSPAQEPHAESAEGADPAP